MTQCELWFIGGCHSSMADWDFIRTTEKRTHNFTLRTKPGFFSPTTQLLIPLFSHATKTVIDRLFQKQLSTPTVCFCNPPPRNLLLYCYILLCVLFLCAACQHLYCLCPVTTFFPLPLINSVRPREKRHSHPVSVSNSERLPEQALQDVHPAGQVGEGAEALRLPPWPRLRRAVK